LLRGLFGDLAIVTNDCQQLIADFNKQQQVPVIAIMRVSSVLRLLTAVPQTKPPRFRVAVNEVHRRQASSDFFNAVLYKNSAYIKQIFFMSATPEVARLSRFKGLVRSTSPQTSIYRVKVELIQGQSDPEMVYKEVLRGIGFMQDARNNCELGKILVIFNGIPPCVKLRNMLRARGSGAV
jgi:hypothetical protein